MLLLCHAACLTALGRSCCWWVHAATVPRRMPHRARSQLLLESPCCYCASDRASYGRTVKRRRHCVPDTRPCKPPSRYNFQQSISSGLRAAFNTGLSRLFKSTLFRSIQLPKCFYIYLWSAFLIVKNIERISVQKCKPPSVNVMLSQTRKIRSRGSTPPTRPRNRQTDFTHYWKRLWKK